MSGKNTKETDYREERRERGREGQREVGYEYDIRHKNNEQQNITCLNLCKIYISKGISKPKI